MKKILLIISLILLFYTNSVYGSNDYTSDDFIYGNEKSHIHDLSPLSEEINMSKSNLNLIVIVLIIIFMVLIVMVCKFVDKKHQMEYYLDYLKKLKYFDEDKIFYTDIYELDELMSDIDLKITRNQKIINQLYKELFYNINDPLFVIFYDMKKIEMNKAFDYNTVATFYNNINDKYKKWVNLYTNLSKIDEAVSKYDSYQLRKKFNKMLNIYIEIQNKHNINLGYEKNIENNQTRLITLNTLINDIASAYTEDLTKAINFYNKYKSEYKLFKKSYENMLEKEEYYNKT